MVKFHHDLESILVGILISDGWLSINKSGNTRVFFKQSLDKLEYFFSVYNKFSHYCSNYPQLNKTTLKGKTFYSISVASHN